MEQLIRRYGQQEYNYFTDTFTFKVMEMYNVEIKDELGTYHDIEFKTVDTIEMANNHIKRDYPKMGFIACKKEIEELYSFTEWK